MKKKNAPAKKTPVKSSRVKPKPVETPAEKVAREKRAREKASNEKWIEEQYLPEEVDHKAIRKYIALDIEKVTRWAVQLKAGAYKSEYQESFADAAIDLMWEAEDRLVARRQELLESMNFHTLMVLLIALGENPDEVLAGKEFDGCCDPIVEDPVKDPIRLLAQKYASIIEAVSDEDYNLKIIAVANHWYRHKLTPLDLPAPLLASIRFAGNAPAAPEKIVKAAFIDFIRSISNLPPGEISDFVAEIRVAHPLPETGPLKSFPEHPWNDEKFVTLDLLAWLVEGFYPFWTQRLPETGRAIKDEKAAQTEKQRKRFEAGEKGRFKIAWDKWIGICEAYYKSTYLPQNKKKRVPKGLLDQQIKKFAKDAKSYDPDIENTHPSSRTKIENFLLTVLGQPGMKSETMVEVLNIRYTTVELIDECRRILRGGEATE